MGQAETAGMSASRLERVAPTMQDYVDRGVYAGIRTRIARRGIVVHDGVYGQRDKEAGLPMEPDTIFRLYSMTKPVVSTALMALYEEGRFRLIDPVARYIPAFAKFRCATPTARSRPPKRPMQIRDVLTHTSGLIYNFLVETPVGALYTGRRIGDAGVSLAEAIDDIARLAARLRSRRALALQRRHRRRRAADRDRSRASRSPTCSSNGCSRRCGMVDTGFGVPEEKRGRLAACMGAPTPSTSTAS